MNAIDNQMDIENNDFLIDAGNLNEMSEVVSNRGEASGYKSVDLATKIDIINRANASEKYKEISDSLDVNISTIKSILKNSEIYLAAWNKGLYKKDAKKIKGPQREDLEDAIYFWYTELKKDNLIVTGPLICSKALEFAQRLGYDDFKASNGWLERFKRRKGIKLYKSKMAADETVDTAITITPPIQISSMYDSAHNIFTFLETSLYYKALPLNLSSSSKKNASINPPKFTILMCTNLSASEKLPLVIFGTIPPSEYKTIVQSSPVQYVFAENSWVTSDAIKYWLMDLNHWFEQQRRKGSIMLSKSPIHSNIPVDLLESLDFHYVQPTSAHPLKATVLPAFKRNYRESLLSQFNLHNQTYGNTKDFQCSLDFYISLLAKAWDDVSDIEIRNSFQRSGISLLDSSEVSDLLYCNIRPEIYQEYKNNSPATSSMLTFIEYVHIDDDVSVYDEKLLDDAIVKESLSKSINLSGGSCDPDIQKNLETLENFIKLDPNYKELNEKLNEFKQLIIARTCAFS